jgi:hypothetical protein
MESIQLAAYGYWSSGSGPSLLEWRGWDVRFSTHFYLVPTLRINGAGLPFHHTSSWCGAKLRTGTTLHFSLNISIRFSRLTHSFFFRRLHINIKKTCYFRHVPPSVCSYLRVYRHFCHWANFREIWCWGMTRKSV